MKYAEIFQLRIRHTYFESGFCPDLMVMPIGDTQKLIEGRRCLLQRQADRIILLAELDTQNQLITGLEQELELRFGLAVGNESFFRITELPQPASHQMIFTSENATVLAANHYALNQTSNPVKEDQYWAHAIITLGNEIAQQPQPPLLFDIELEAIEAPWQVFLSTSQIDDNLRIEPGNESVFFHKTALDRLLSLQTDYDMVSGLDTESVWTGTELNGNGLDFAVSASGLQSQGPATAASIHAATQIAPVNGLSWSFRITLGFTPDADNRQEILFNAHFEEPEHSDQACYLLSIGETGSNRLRLFRRTPGQTDQEIGAGSTTYTGSIDLEIEVTWLGGEWKIEAADPGQAKSEEIKVVDQTVEAGGQFIVAATWLDPAYANQFVIQTLEIKIPLGSPADIERKKAVANTLAELFPDKNQYLFASAGPVTLKETPRKGISLKNGSSTLIEHMGNPSPDDNGTQFILI